MQIPQYPFEQIAIDTSGPFPESYEGNRYIINIIDMFSGWPEAFPTKSKSAESVAKILVEYIIPRHSCPRVIVSDNGTEFCNAVIDQINAFFNIKHITTSIYHPQANGKAGPAPQGGQRGQPPPQLPAGPLFTEFVGTHIWRQKVMFPLCT